MKEKNKHNLGCPPGWGCHLFAWVVPLFYCHLKKITQNAKTFQMTGLA